jgi:hypothetical protein
MIPTAVRTINQAVMFAELGEDAVLLNTDTGVYFGLDAVGTRIWTLLAEGLSDDQIHAQLFGEYAVDGDELTRDIARLLGQLEACGLVTRPTPM